MCDSDRPAQAEGRGGGGGGLGSVSPWAELGQQLGSDTVFSRETSGCGMEGRWPLCSPPGMLCLLCAWAVSSALCHNN